MTNAPGRALGRIRRASGLALATCVAAACVAHAQGIAVEGGDAARILAPVGTTVEPYANVGYSLTVEDGEVRVRTDAQPLRSLAPFAVPRAGARRQPIERLALSLVRGARTQFDAAARILGWVSREIRYSYDRGASQDAAAVLVRRTGYCTGVARLTVALLRSAGLEAREVAGWIAGDGRAGSDAAVYHRWVEVYYADRGWVFSDPLATHNWVPASYVRLASERVDASGLDGGLLLERRDGVSPVDVYGEAAAAVRARRNDGRQRAASLRVEVAGGDAGMLTLEGDGRRRTSAMQLGAGVFVGLAPGQYLLHVSLPGRPTLLRQIRMHGRVKSALYLSPPAGSSAVEGQSR